MVWWGEWCGRLLSRGVKCVHNRLFIRLFLSVDLA